MAELLLPEPGVSVGCILHGGVIGIAYGSPSRRKAGFIILRGIAVQSRQAKLGYGSRLLQFFESRSQERGFHAVSLGSAGGYVDHFYEKNGYHCVAYLVSAPEDMDGLAALRQRYSEFLESAESDSSFSIDAESMGEDTRRQFLADFQGARLNAIMDKAIGGS